MARVREGETVMRLLRSRRKVQTRYGGKFVQSIDGLAGSTRGGLSDWFYFVNGIEAKVGAADREVSPGDVIQWDYRPWEAAQRVPAVVGAYPEPFLHGSEGKRLPTRVECEDEDAFACGEVRRRLAAAGVPATGAPIGAAASAEVLRVIVARWAVARRLRAAGTLEQGPRASGVFARFTDRGTKLRLLDQSGRVARLAPGGSGLVAATSLEGQGTVWLVTGIDDPAVSAAANALDRSTLRDAFAVVATPGGTVRLPVAAAATP